MEKKIIRNGLPFICAGGAVLVYAAVFGMGSILGYLVGAALGVAAFFAGKKLFPDKEILVETRPQSGNAEVDAMIEEARVELERISAANDAIPDPELSRQIDDIETTCRQILSRLEEQPQRLGSLRTFLRYYLPTTLKLLDVRAKIEVEISSGKSKEIAGRISEAISQVQTALHKQLDALNEYRFIDLESEMDVLSDMLRSEGLTEEEKTVQAAEPEKKTEDDPFAGLFARGEK